MRKPRFFRFVHSALLAPALLASCDRGPSLLLLLPNCAEGQLLFSEGTGALGCRSLLAGLPDPSTPTCIPDSRGVDPSGQALTVSADAVSGNFVLTCVDKATGVGDEDISRRLSVASTQITNLQDSLTLLQRRSIAKYIGHTTTPSVGYVMSGNFVGAYAGAKLCDSDLGVTGSHICSPFDIYESMIVGDKLNQDTSAAESGPFMVYMQAAVPNFAPGGSEPGSGQGENCGAETYRTAARYWRNTTFTLGIPAGSTIKVPMFDASVSCYNAYPLACCL